MVSSELRVAFIKHKIKQIFRLIYQSNQTCMRRKGWKKKERDEGSDEEERDEKTGDRSVCSACWEREDTQHTE